LGIQKNFKENAKSLNLWCEFIGKVWKKEQEAILNFVKSLFFQKINFLFVDTKIWCFCSLKWYTHIFEFLNVDTNKEIIKKLLKTHLSKNLKIANFLEKQV